MTDKMEFFISESSVYRILKAYDLITSPAFTKDKFERPKTRALADGFCVSEGRPLGLVLSVISDGRLLALYHRLATLPYDEGRGFSAIMDPASSLMREGISQAQ
jgi:hypothetical protein